MVCQFDGSDCGCVPADGLCGLDVAQGQCAGFCPRIDDFCLYVDGACGCIPADHACDRVNGDTEFCRANGFCQVGEECIGDDDECFCVPVPTATPAPTPAATPAGIPLVLRPPGGTPGSCQGTCLGGANPGAPCSEPSDCPGSSCNGTCVGGPRDGAACSQAFNCSGCALDPPQGACNFYKTAQFSAFSGLEGLCTPSTTDKFCTTDAECPSGSSCRLPSLGRVVLSSGTTFTVDTSTFWLAPYGSPYGIACVAATGSGFGTIKCTSATPTGQDYTFEADHNTTPSSPGNGGSTSGLPDDAGCSRTSSFLGLPSFACSEGTSQCLGGANNGAVCTADANCTGGACVPCNRFAAHTGVCNSPLDVTIGGAFAENDMRIVIPVSVSYLQPGDEGGDNRPCTGDDTAPEMATWLIATTGVADAAVYDANNTAGATIQASRGGTAIDCADLAAGDTDGLVLVGGVLGRGIDAPAPFGDFTALSDFAIGNPAHY